MRYAPPLTPSEIAQIRKLRYQDGLTRAQVAAITGRTISTIGVHAPGKPLLGVRVPNAPIRDAVQAAVDAGTLSWGEIAARLDMTCPPNNRGTKRRGDSACLKRHLGFLPSYVSGTGRNYQPTIGADLARRICEIIDADLDDLLEDIGGTGDGTGDGGPCPDCGEPMIAPAPRCGFCIAERQLVAA